MRIQNKIKKHSLKLISVFLSVFLWFYVLNSEKIKFEKVVGIDYILPQDMAFSKKAPKEVVFLLDGPRAFMRTVLEKDDRIQIDLNQLNPKKLSHVSVDINPDDLTLPFGMVVEKTLPRKLEIQMERKATKIVPLKAHFNGSLSDKISLISSKLEPSEVEISGPRSIISKLKELRTRTIDLDHLGSGEELNVEVFIPDERLILGQSSHEVKFIYKLKASSSNLSLNDIPILFLRDKKEITSDISKVSLKLHVPEKILKSRTNLASAIQVWAEIPNDAKGKVEVPLKVLLPPSIHLIEIKPKSIVVNIK